jgi:hypothetical protein
VAAAHALGRAPRCRAQRLKQFDVIADLFIRYSREGREAAAFHLRDVLAGPDWTCGDCDGILTGTSHEKSIVTATVGLGCSTAWLLADRRTHHSPLANSLRRFVATPS